MNGFMFGFCACLLSAMLWPSLLPAPLIPVVILGGLLLAKISPLLSGSLSALAWISSFGLILLPSEALQLPPSVSIRGEIITLVDRNSDWVSLDIALINRNLILAPLPLPRPKLRLTWRDPPPLAPGQIWRLELKPKGLSSLLDQGGYNQQKHLIGQHIIARGRVIHGELLMAHTSVRQAWLNLLLPVLRPLERGDILLALLLGDKRLIGAQRWQALRQTGTGHLVAISGLHLSVVAAWAYALALWFGRLWPSQGRRNLLIALTLAAGSAWGYAYLAGFGIATQRALLMILLLMLLGALRRFSSPWERLLTALFLVLLISPFAGLSAGFWLSFSALAIILFSLQSYPHAAQLADASAHASAQTDPGIGPRVGLWARQFWAVQWRLSLGLGLLQALLFQGFSLHSLWLNLLLVPYFSFLVIPLVLLVFMLWDLGLAFGQDWHWLWVLADASLQPFTALIDFSNRLPAHWLQPSQAMLAAAIFTGLGLLLLLKARPSAHAGWQRWGWHLALSVCLLPALLSLWLTLYPIAQARWRVHLLDVGQGLAVVVEKSGRALLYDTGAAFGDFSYAERVILPFLSSKGLSALDYLVISHGDNDHAGGARTMLAAFNEARVISDLPEFGQINCRPKRLAWQGLSLEIVGPAQAVAGNNGSCVIRIGDERQKLLLTGDIEADAEQALLAGGAQLHSQVLIAPHHGSRTSSSPAFIAAVAPELVLFPAGFENRYGFPKADIVQRYRAQGIRALSTGEAGQISVLFNRDERVVRGYRADLAPFWYNRLFRFGETPKPE
ncbi:DNA internalization-related competence protein ComEC/Rec2 [Shewanella salipaludis]|uniref:DNA internalization-related competence protein ComEC/Rec2 n=1 Tax=Shewanella salipaludis TaxID=2723052 RepID=A0A972FP92_9GAMM|nr:DNA internalization-related competence protein ComEC/Rec2 [Shewanella salipaludis]NMH63595.1 DNA internalization-related competence protein ComEC/Rec2 [Shewanella salipaludis]